LVDIDGDGHLDILSGSYSRMEEDMAGLFQVLYGKGDGTFRKAEVLKGTDGKPLIIPAKGDAQLTEKICTRPFAVDWDGDGHLDLVVGNFAGTFYWFKGLGKGKFLPKPERIKAGGAPLRIKGAHSDPFVIDWDGDGSLDLVSGSSDGGVYWARNKAGTGRMPDLEPFRPLIKPRPSVKPGQILRERDLTGPTHATRVWVADVNGDGKLDLLVGDCVTLVSPANGLSDAEFKTRHAAWQKDFQAAQAALSAARDDESRQKAQQEFQRVYGQRTAFMREEMTGFVWLYLQE
jgi:FG-GAP-like repeat